MFQSFQVTQNHINAGHKSDIRLCPIALAINGELKPEYRAWIGMWGMHITEGDKRVFSEQLPTLVRRFRYDFDNYNHVTPISFTLSIPAKYVKD